MTDPTDPRARSAAAGTLARDANEVKVTPAGWIRERLHIGDGHFAWSEPFDPVARALEEQTATDTKLDARGALTVKDREALGDKVRRGTSNT